MSHTPIDHYRHACEVKERHKMTLLAFERIQGVGVRKTEDGQYCIFLYLQQMPGEDIEAVRRFDRELPRELEGVPVRSSFGYRMWAY